MYFVNYVNKYLMLLLGLGIRVKEERRNNGKGDWKRQKKMEGGRLNDRGKKGMRMEGR